MICGDMGSTLPHRVKRLAIDHLAADLPLYYAMEPFDPTLN